MIRKSLLLATLVALPVLAQTTPRRGYVAAYGEASVSVRPDMARVNLGVLTQAQSATDAAARNAESAAAVIAAIRGVLGASAEVRTISYNVGPTYSYQTGGQPTLTGFQVTNVVQAVINDTNLIGRVIDAGIQAGANRVDGIGFGLKEEEPVRAQALRTAAQKARQKAESIAAGLGVRLGSVIAADEGYQISRSTNLERSAAPAASTATPVESGTMDVRATVTLQLEVVPQ